MSVTYTCDVFCDRCGIWITGATGGKAPGLARKALAVAKKKGWSRDVRSTYLDVCPNCLNEGEKHEALPATGPDSRGLHQLS